MEEIVSALGWVVTPALVISIALALVRFVDAGSRWERRLRGDLQLLSGLPQGNERERLEMSVTRQARRLREYKQAYGPRRQVIKWAQIALVAVTLALLIRYPPINTPETRIPFAPFDYMMMAAGGFAMVVAVSGLVRGRDWWNRTAPELTRNDRVRRHNRRARRLRRLDKVRFDHIEKGADLKPNGSRLGFQSQVDELGPWMRTPELRRAAVTRGTPARDLDFEAREAVRRSGQKLPRT